MYLLELLQVPNEGYNGWIVGIATVVGGVITTLVTQLVSLYKKKSEDSTKIKLTDNNELLVKNNELVAKITDVEAKLNETVNHLQAVVQAFDIIFPMIQQMAEEKPEVRATIDKAANLILNYNKNKS